MLKFNVNKIMDIKELNIKKQIIQYPFANKEIVDNWLDRLFSPPNIIETPFNRPAEIHKYIFWKNMSIIKSYSESEIERLFLNALCINNPVFYQFVFLNPLKDIVHDIKDLKNIFIRRDDFNKIGYPHEKSWGDDVDLFFENKNIPYKKDDFKNAPTFLRPSKDRILMKKILTSMKLDFNKNEIETTQPFNPVSFYMDFSMIYSRCTFVTIQSKFNFESINIRPDIFFWHPLTQLKLIVECDGYAYHKDKYTFEKDRKRDRLLTKLGYEHMRYSGAEINRDPILSSLELSEFIFKTSVKKIEY